MHVFLEAPGLPTRSPTVIEEKDTNQPTNQLSPFTLRNLSQPFTSSTLGVLSENRRTRAWLDGLWVL